MKLKSLSLLTAALLLLIFTPLAGASDQGTPTGTPAAVPLNPVFEFDPVPEGFVIVHDFKIKNMGTGVLDIQKVKTGWGCTTVSYTKQILPGREGIIKIKVKTYGFAGGILNKKIRVQTNDKTKPSFQFTVKGPVDKFVTISPPRINMKGKPGEVLTRQVRISPEAKYPFKILNGSLEKVRDMKLSIKKDETTNPPSYLATLTSQETAKGSIYGNIVLKTDSQVRPEIKIFVAAVFKE